MARDASRAGGARAGPAVARHDLGHLGGQGGELLGRHQHSVIGQAAVLLPGDRPVAAFVRQVAGRRPVDEAGTTSRGGSRHRDYAAMPRLTAEVCGELRAKSDDLGASLLLVVALEEAGECVDQQVEGRQHVDLLIELALQLQPVHGRDE